MSFCLVSHRILWKAVAVSEADGVLGVAVVIVAARVDEVPHRGVPIAVLVPEVVPAALTRVHEPEAIRVRGLQHLVPHAAQAAATAEAAHQEAQVRVQAAQHDRGKPPQVAPKSHRAHQHGTPPQHATSNAK